MAPPWSGKTSQLGPGFRLGAPERRTRSASSLQQLRVRVADVQSRFYTRMDPDKELLVLFRHPGSAPLAPIRGGVDDLGDHLGVVNSGTPPPGSVPLFRDA